MKQKGSFMYFNQILLLFINKDLFESIFSVSFWYKKKTTNSSTNSNKKRVWDVKSWIIGGYVDAIFLQHNTNSWNKIHETINIMEIKYILRLKVNMAQWYFIANYYLSNFLSYKLSWFFE